MPSDQKQTTVVLAVDTSNSMAATDVNPSRIAAARAAARDLIKGLPKNAKVGLVSFARDVQRAARAHGRPRRHQRARATAHPDAAAPRSAPAIDRSVASLRASHPALKGRAIIVISDGKSTEGTRSPIAAARAAKAAGSARLHGLARHGRRHRQGEGRNTSPCRPTRRRCGASPPTSGGRFYRAEDAKSLQNAYHDIGSAVKPQHKKRDISFAFVAAPWRSWREAACSPWPGSAACSRHDGTAQTGSDPAWRGLTPGGGA